jgi:hypothetical protein
MANSSSPWSLLDPLTYVNEILGLDIGGVGSNPLSSWLSSIGGSIASGLEGGAVAFIRDIFNVVVGPLEVGLGVIVIMFALVICFKDDLLQAGLMFGMMSA